MGVYWYSVKKQPKVVDGVKLGVVNFYGKGPGIFGSAPSWLDVNRGNRNLGWESFLRNAGNAAKNLTAEGVTHIMDRDGDVYEWSGWGVQSDDTNRFFRLRRPVGKVVKQGRKNIIVWGEQNEAA